MQTTNFGSLGLKKGMKQLSMNLNLNMINKHQLLFNVASNLPWPVAFFDKNVKRNFNKILTNTISWESGIPWGCTMQVFESQSFGFVSYHIQQCATNMVIQSRSTGINCITAKELKVLGFLRTVWSWALKLMHWRQFLSLFFVWHKQKLCQKLNQFSYAQFWKIMFHTKKQQSKNIGSESLHDSRRYIISLVDNP